MSLRLLLPALAAIGVVTLLFLPADAFADGIDISSLDSECIATELQSCVVLTSGRINADMGASEGEPMFGWQTQGGFTEADGVKGGFVLLMYENQEWSVFDSGFEAYRYEIPRLGVDGMTIHVAGTTAGTGAYNADRLYAFGDTGAAVYREAWRPIDIETWKADVAEMLPDGLEIWKGVDYDFSDSFYGDLNARTPLWQADDANCCPSGGVATIHFELDLEANLLVATSIDHQPAGQ